MTRFNSFIGIPVPADGHYDLAHDLNGKTMWGEICKRLFDVDATGNSEFGRQILDAIWMCIRTDEFMIGRLLNVRVTDDRGYTRLLPHIVLDIAHRIQKGNPSSIHNYMRRILGSAELSDRFIGAVCTSCLMFEDVPVERVA